MTEQDINNLLKVFDSRLHCYPLNVVDAIRFLVKQRNEERREACRNDLDVWMGIYTAKEVAAMRGWNCFDAEGDKTC
jgi:hypothetical protein